MSRLAPTLAVFRDQVNDKWPVRDTTSDGTIGDKKHRDRKSDHNPDLRGVICAWDCDEDLAGKKGRYPHIQPGQGLRALVDATVRAAKAGRLPQLYYVIYEGKIYSRTRGFKPKDADGHDHHAHFSVYHSAHLADRTNRWDVFTEDKEPHHTYVTVKATGRKIIDKNRITVDGFNRASVSEDSIHVYWVQVWLDQLDLLEGSVDGRRGEKTMNSLYRFRRSIGWDPESSRGALGIAALTRLADEAGNTRKQLDLE